MMSTSDMLNFFTKLYSYIRQLNSRQMLKGKSPSANLMFLFNPVNSSIVKIQNRGENRSNIQFISKFIVARDKR